MTRANPLYLSGLVLLKHTTNGAWLVAPKTRLALIALITIGTVHTGTASHTDKTKPTNKFIDVPCTAPTSPCHRNDVIPNEMHFIYKGYCTDQPVQTPTRMTCKGDTKYVHCKPQPPSVSFGYMECNCLDGNLVQGGEASVVVYC